jgi:hypothetical protein
MLASVKDRPSGESEAHPGPLGEHNFAHAHERMERSGQAQELKGSYRMRNTFWRAKTGRVERFGGGE